MFIFGSKLNMGNKTSKKSVAITQRQKILELGNKYLFSNEEILHISQCFAECYPSLSSALTTSDSSFLIHWNIYASTIVPTHNDNFETVRDKNLSNERETKQYQRVARIKVMEEKLLPPNFTKKFQTVAFEIPEILFNNCAVDLINKGRENRGLWCRTITHAILPYSTQETLDDRTPWSMAHFELFLQRFSDSYRCGIRSAINILYKCCTNSGTVTETAYARDLIRLAYGMALACLWFEESSQKETDVKEESFYPQCLPQELIQSLVNYQDDFDTTTVSDTYSELVSLESFLQWTEKMAPCLGFILPTFLHFIFFPDRSYPSSGTKFSFPNIRDQYSAFFGMSTGENIHSQEDMSSPLLFSLACMSQSLQGTWYRLYTSHIDGLSFNRFLNAILGYEGPTLVLIRDTQSSHIFGAYTSSAWKESKDYYGSSNCFLFGLVPTMTLIRPRCSHGYKNYMYCNPKRRSKGYDGLPHGIGFGGTFDHFRLFISESLQECTATTSDLTFEVGELLPSTSDIKLSRTTFSVESLEVWGVGSDVVVKNALRKRNDRREIIASNIRKARKIDKAQLLEDFQTGLLESKMFQHRKESRVTIEG